MGRVAYQLGENHFANTSYDTPKHNPSGDLPVPQVTGKKSEPSDENIDYQTSIPQVLDVVQ